MKAEEIRGFIREIHMDFRDYIVASGIDHPAFRKEVEEWDL